MKRYALLFVFFAIAVGALFSIPSPPPAMSTDPVSTTSLIVKMVAGLSPEQTQAVVLRDGGTETSSVPALRLHIIEVSYAELASALANYQSDPQVERVEINQKRQAEAVPSDGYYAGQWALPKIGWDTLYGAEGPSGSATVAVLDTGVDATHPDLAGNVVPGTSILDGSDGLSDANGHGTWMAGIIAAATNNGLGIAGVGYSGVRVMPVTVLDANGTGQDGDIIKGVVWAADNGADVILMAFSNPGFSQNLQDAIDYAWSKGIVLVAATGNGGISTPTFPAGDRGVVGVSSTDASDELSPDSNTGQDVFLAAPGVNIYTTSPGGGYTEISGTSASAAIVAGVAAFARAFHPGLDNGIIVGRLARTADPAGTQDQTGNGRVNMARAVADTSTTSIEPAGAAPVGDGGPFVGPYVAAATSLTLTPTSGPSGTSVAVASGGSPFDHNKTNIGIYWNGTINTISGTLVTTCSSSNGGNITGTCTFTVPSSSAGAHTVVATQQDNTSKSLSAQFTVSVTPTPTPTNTPTNTSTATNTPLPTDTPTPLPTDTPTPLPTDTPTPLPTDTPTPLPTDTPTPLPTDTPVPPTATNTPAPIPPTATNTPTPAPSGPPRLTGSIAAKGPYSPGVLFINLKLTNTGTGNGSAISVNQFVLKTLSGTGTVSYNTSLSPALPIAVGSLGVGASSTTTIYLNVPGTVTRFSITENGTMKDGASTTYSFSIGQSVIP